MPAAYEAMRDHFIREGLRTKAAKTKAARIYNSRGPKQPVTGAADRDPRDGRDNRDNRGMGD